MRSIVFIGCGWNSAHVALQLKKLGHNVIILEKKKDIFEGVSGQFGVRLHVGPHYPRSEETRKNCQKNYYEFLEAYPDLVVEHEYSVYGLGEKDADGQPPKVNYEQFKAVCQESPGFKEIDPQEHGYKNLIAAMEVNEPSIAVGPRLRETFRKYLKDANIPVICNFNVTKIIEKDNKVFIPEYSETEGFDYVVNATGYQSLLPQEKLPFNIEFIYQPCLALKYEDRKPTNKPFSFIVMDGWFPCMMPYEDGSHDFEGAYRNYILTHGKWTIMGSCKTAQEAHGLLSRVKEDAIELVIKPECEKQINHFWPEFRNRFNYVGTIGNVLCKPLSTVEFRSEFTFMYNKMIYIIPGKVSNIFDVEREIVTLINDKPEQRISKGNFHYLKEGVLDSAMHEVTNKPKEGDRNTGLLQTFEKIQKQLERIRRDAYVRTRDASTPNITYFFKSGNRYIKSERSSQKPVGIAACAALSTSKL